MPKILIFLLDKGDKEEDFNFKIEDLINFNKFCNNKDNKKLSPKKYRLIGIISINKEDKKYVSFCSIFENKKEWYYFKDEKVKKKKEDEILFENNDNKIFSPCILFYQAFDENK